MAVKYNKYGWKPDLPDHRDLKFVAPMSAVELPKSVDLRPFMPTPYDQGELGSCTANSLAGLLEYNERKENKPNAQTASRLFIYYNERLIEHTINQDAGAMLRDGIKALVRFGYCEEVLWPYVISQFKKKPSRIAYKDASQSKISKYARIGHSLNDMKAALASGNPFVFGFTVFESFESEVVARTGMVPMPMPTEQALGGHAVLAVGYDDDKQAFLVRNSWGVTWGLGGYFYLPYEFILNPGLADDFWTIFFM